MADVKSLLTSCCIQRSGFRLTVMHQFAPLSPPCPRGGTGRGETPIKVYTSSSIHFDLNIEITLELRDSSESI